MIVLGYTVPEYIESECILHMHGGFFRAAHIAAVAQAFGAPLNREGGEIPGRIADRLIQRERKAGNLVRVGSPLGWRWK